MKPGQRLLAARTKAGMTVRALAEVADVGIATISDYENGNGDLRLQSALDICRALKVSLDWLATGKEVILAGPGSRLSFAASRGE